jgi:hypothetical protein
LTVRDGSPATITGLPAVGAGDEIDEVIAVQGGLHR